MDSQVIVAFVAVACVAILSPGPATILAIRNGTTFGVRSAVWSTLGNASGLFCLSAASMLGLGVLLESSAVLFGALKIVGAMYLFYLGARQLLGHTKAISIELDDSVKPTSPLPRHLYREALLTAATNPKPILFFTALFPQFINEHAPLLMQFFVLTGIFVSISFVSLLSYALLSSVPPLCFRARGSRSGSIAPLAASSSLLARRSSLCEGKGRKAELMRSVAGIQY